MCGHKPSTDRHSQPPCERDTCCVHSPPREILTWVSSRSVPRCSGMRAKGGPIAHQRKGTWKWTALVKEHPEQPSEQLDKVMSVGNVVTSVSPTLAIPRSLLPTNIEILLCRSGEINLLITCQTWGLLTMLAKRITEPPVSLGKKGGCQVPSWLRSQLRSWLTSCRSRPAYLS